MPSNTGDPQFPTGLWAGDHFYRLLIAEAHCPTLPLSPPCRSLLSPAQAPELGCSPRLL